jgi:Brp/Blh family beta-carotene 15,15'-monooxygenase
MRLNPMRWQGLGFSLLALLTGFLSLFLPPFSPQCEWWLAAWLILLLGVPHGALDPLFAQAFWRIKSRAAWLGFILVYLLLAASVVLLWWWLPMVFLIGFLAVSVLHFSGDLSSGATFFERLVFGTAVVALPAAWHASELLRLFSQLVGANAAQPVVAALQLIAWPCMLALLCWVAWALVRRKNSDGWRTMEMAALGLLALTATPLLGFAVYFCAMHSARHILRTQRFTSVAPIRMALVAALPILGLLVLSAIGWTLWPAGADTSISARQLQWLFVALAALTLPHMLLVERLRLTDWQSRP